MVGATTASAVGAGAQASAETSVPTTDPPSSSSSEPTTTTTSTTTTTTTPTTTTTTTTTTVPVTTPALLVDGPAVPSRITPTRGTQAQVTETLPPPPTTTTTMAPPSWELPVDSGTGRRVVYSKSRQRVWTVESDGTVSQTHLVSGRQTWNQPLPGTYSVFSRSSYTCNIKNNNICWRYMIRFTKGPGGDNIGFHEIPKNTTTGRPVQSDSELGTALSSGCVRQATPDAQYMWGWAGVGTKVVVLG